MTNDEQFPMRRTLLKGALTVMSAMAVLATGATPATATVVQSLSLYEKVQYSPLIVRGVAERVRPSWEAEGRSVQTLVTFRVTQVIKGQADKGDLLIIQQPGGTIGDFEHRVPGVSQWRDQQEAIMFLEPAGPYLVELGIGIGKYDVERSAKGAVVTHNPSVALATVEPSGELKIAPADPMKPEALSQFVKRLTGYAKKIARPNIEKKPIRHPRPTVRSPKEGLSR